MYIVLEGIDGSGKSTLQRALVAALQALGRSVVSLVEPTEGVHGQKIREHLGSKSRSLSGEEWQQLFEADRADNMASFVRPAIERGDDIVQDRSYYSTVAYQGAQGQSVADILRRNRAIAVEPDLVLILDLDPEVSLERVRRRQGMETDAFERIEYLQQVRANFRAMQGPNIVHIDASLGAEALFDACWRVVQSRLGSKRA